MGLVASAKLDVERPLAKVKPFGRVTGQRGAAQIRLGERGGMGATERRWCPIQASARIFVSTWMAKSRRTLAGAARKRSMAVRASLMAAVTSDLLIRKSGS